MNEDFVNVSILCKGLVQEVFYRMKTKETATKLGITGWIKNLKDGSVLINACGEPDAINNLIDWCNKGPALAKVDEVSVKKIQPMENIDSFEIIY